MEDVLSSRKRGSEEVGLAEDPRLIPADELVGIREMAEIFMSLGVAPANVKVVELFCRNRFGDAAVSMGFERGIVADCATGWDMEDEELMEEVERRVRDEEPVLLIGFPIERRQAQKHRGAMRQRTSSFAAGCARRSGLQDGCSCMSIHVGCVVTLSFVQEMAEKGAHFS